MRNVNVTNYVNEYIRTPGVIGRSVTAGNTATTLGALNAKTRYVLLQVQAQPVRLTYDGENPTSSVGFRYDANATLMLSVTAARGVKVIREGSSDATIYVQEFTR